MYFENKQVYPTVTDEYVRGFFGEYRWLSNFYLAPIKVRGILFPSSEHAYQAFKTQSLKLRRAMAKLPMNEIKGFARTIPLREGWDEPGVELRLRAMEKVIKAKFDQHPDLADKLRATGTRHLEETNYWNDRYWGVVRKPHPVGENHLGIILMDRRNVL